MTLLMNNGSQMSASDTFGQGVDTSQNDMTVADADAQMFEALVSGDGAQARSQPLERVGEVLANIGDGLVALAEKVQTFLASPEVEQLVQSVQDLLASPDLANFLESAELQNFLANPDLDTFNALINSDEAVALLSSAELEAVLQTGFEALQLALNGIGGETVPVNSDNIEALAQTRDLNTPTAEMASSPEFLQLMQSEPMRTFTADPSKENLATLLQSGQFAAFANSAPMAALSQSAGA